MARSKSRAARELAVALSAAAGVPVELRWDSSTMPHDTRWGWHVDWSDGPTARTMITLTTREIAAHRSSVLTVTDLTFVRNVHPASYALAIVRNIRRGLPPLGALTSMWALEQALAATEYPERGDDEDRALAAVLIRLADYIDDAMPDAARRYGVTGLQAERHPPDNVISIHRDRHPH